MSVRSVAAVAALVFLLGGGVYLVLTRQVGRERTGSAGLRVVTTTPVLFSLTAQVVGDRAALVSLVPPGSSPENYALRPQDAEALARADVLVINGLQFEQFLDRALAGARRRGVSVVTASEGVKTEGQPPNPHIWLDPIRASQMVHTITRGLTEVDPRHAAFYNERARLAIGRLEALDREFQAHLSAVPHRTFVAFHPAWTYFAERYGLTQVAAIEKVPGVEPTAQELTDLVARVRSTKTRALMVEPQFSSRIAEAFARDAGLRTTEVNPEGGDLSPGGYEQMMRANVAQFVRSLSEP